MERSLRLGALAVLAGVVLLAAGCNTRIPADQFLAKYTTNIEVPNPDSAELPARIFLGRNGDDFRIKDVIPYTQGGGFLGTTILWVCPAAALPADFPVGAVPGDTVFDGRKGSSFTYMIQWYRSQQGAAGTSGP